MYDDGTMAWSVVAQEGGADIDVLASVTERGDADRIAAHYRKAWGASVAVKVKPASDVDAGAFHAAKRAPHGAQVIR